MSLIFMDGFDTIPSAAGGYGSPTNKWAAGFTLDGPYAGRFGGQAFRSISTNNGSYCRRYIPQVTSGTFIMGMALKHDTPVLGGTAYQNYQRLLTITDNGTGPQCGLFIVDSGRLAIVKGTWNTGNPSANIIDVTPSQVILANVWHYLEFKVNIGEFGEYEVRLDNNLLFQDVNVDTTNAINTSSDIIEIFGSENNGSNRYCYVDDFYICDNNGTTNNDFLGDCRVQTLVPNANIDANFTPSTGSNFECLNELPVNITDNVSSNVPDTVDLYDMSTLDYIPSDIYAIQTGIVAKKDNVGDRYITSRVVSGTTTTESLNSLTLTASYEGIYDVIELNPDTSAEWTKADIDDVKLGFKVT